ncbi:MAG: hypothetical protein JSS81_27410 [Acidobacteria bacterium]|nr:hypothetical protein [Acidobacteriota bacterium]
MMSKEIEIVRVEAYEEIAMEFQAVQALELDEALQDCGIDDIELRKKICRRFAFGMGNFLDQYFFKVNGKPFYPVLCFSEGFIHEESDGVPEKLHLPTAEYEFHSSADGCVESYFDGDAVVIGIVGDEDGI